MDCKFGFAWVEAFCEIIGIVRSVSYFFNRKVLDDNVDLSRLLLPLLLIDGNVINPLRDIVLTRHFIYIF